MALTEIIVEVSRVTVSVSAVEACCCGLPLSWTFTVMLNVPEAVGVPLRAPVAAFIDMPFGWPETDQVYGCVPPVADMACAAVYPVPTVVEAGLNAVLVIVSGVKRSPPE